MFIYATSGLINAILISCLGLAVYLKNRKSTVNSKYAIFCAFVAFWCLSYFFWQAASDATKALFWCRALMAGAIFIPVTFLDFTLVFLHIEAKQKKLLRTTYGLFFLFFLLNFTPWFVRDVVARLGFPYWPRPGVAFTPYLAIWGSCCFYPLYLLFRELRFARGIRKNQLRYLIIGVSIGYIGGATNYFLWYNIPVPPYGNFFVPLSIGLMAYAIVKFHLMDIRLAVTRVGVFIVVYSVILGLPLLIGFKLELWGIALLLMGILASAGPFIYGRLKGRAEEVLLEEQKRYQHALRELAKKMTQIKELGILLKLVADEIFTIVEPLFVGLYTFTEHNKQRLYTLQNACAKDKYPLAVVIPIESDAVKYLEHHNRPLFLDELGDAHFRTGSQDTLIVPQYINQRLYGFLIVGPKSNNTIYSNDDIAVFDILSNQLSLAIENCLFWQDEKQRLVREEQIRRHQTMDHFSYSMAHEIDNPVQAIVLLIRTLETVIENAKDALVTDTFIDMCKSKMHRMNHNLGRISKMIKAVTEFSKPTDGSLERIRLDDVVESYLYMMEPMLKHDAVTLTKKIESDIYVNGNKIHLEEVLMNLTKNAVHAVKYNNQKEKTIELTVTRLTNTACLVSMRDNGYGIKEDMLEDIFLDFVTTKASTEGTGIGLARVRKIIERHGGKIWAESTGQGKGSTFFVQLPTA